MYKALLLTLALAGSMTAANAQDQQAGCDHGKYRFDDDCRDYTNQGYDLTPYGTTTYDLDRFDKPHKSYYCDGNTYMKSKKFSTKGWQGCTYSCWVKPDRDYNNKCVIVVISGNAIYLNKYSKGRATACYDNDIENNSIDNECGTDLYNGKWHHICCTNDGYKTRLYVNGVEERSYDETYYKHDDCEVSCGGHPDGKDYYKGHLDDVHVYSCALTAQEVAQLFALQALSVGKTDAPTVNFNVYPNPSSNGAATVIETENLGTNSVLSVVDATGRTVEQVILQAGTRKNNLDVSTLPAGIYMVQLRTAEGVSTQRLMIE